MTGFSTPFPGSLSAGLNALASPMGSALPAPLLAQLLGRTGGAGGMPGSLAPQIPMLPGGSRAVGPIPNIPPPPRLPQNNLMPLLGGLGKSLGGSGAANPSPGLFGSNGPLFGSTGLFGSGGPLFGIDQPFGPSMSQAIANYGNYFGSMSPAEYAMGWSPEAYGLSSGAGAAALSGAADAGAAGAADAGLTFGSGMGLGTSSLFGAGAAGAGAAAGGSILDFLPFAFA